MRRHLSITMEFDLYQKMRKEMREMKISNNSKFIEDTIKERLKNAK